MCVRERWEGVCVSVYACFVCDGKGCLCMCVRDGKGYV